MRIAVGIATVGRPRLLCSVVDELLCQLRSADRVVVSAPTVADIDGLPAHPAVDVVIGARGLTHQRNAILGRVEDFDVVQFFDDDFLPAPDYLTAIAQVFERRPDIVMATGTVIADGIIGPGIGLDEARQILNASQSVVADACEPVANGYGCNMAVRVAAVRAARCRFDEQLPLYAWLEDVDFSHQLARHGRIVKIGAARGIHLGIKQGRQSGVRLGYSQIANPIYLSRKGTCPWPHALRLMSRNIVANLVRALHPEPYVDRAGRVVGNFKGIGDLVSGRLDPRRILELQ